MEVSIYFKEGRHETVQDVVKVFFNLNDVYDLSVLDNNGDYWYYFMDDIKDFRVY